MGEKMKTWAGFELVDVFYVRIEYVRINPAFSISDLAVSAAIIVHSHLAHVNIPKAATTAGPRLPPSFPYQNITDAVRGMLKVSMALFSSRLWACVSGWSSL
jgi:hypothetical protein